MALAKTGCNQTHVAIFLYKISPNSAEISYLEAKKVQRNINSDNLSCLDVSSQSIVGLFTKHSEKRDISRCGCEAVRPKPR